MTQRGQWYDFTERTGSCEFGYRRTDGLCPCPKTHVVKWQAPGREGRLRHYTCARHAAMIVAYQKTLGADVRAYRYRKG